MESSEDGTPGDQAQIDLEVQRFEEWVKSRGEFHEGGHVVTNETAAWTPVRQPLSESTVAIITSMGVHLRTQEPFDILAPGGDPTIRVIPGDVATADLTATHGHVDTRSIHRDLNVGFPIDRLRELKEAGRVGKVADRHYGIMGFCPQVERMRDEVAPQIIETLIEDSVDLVLMVPG